VRHLEQVREDRALDDVAVEASDRVERLARADGVRWVAFAVDLWTSVEVTLLTGRPEGALDDEVYEVPYLSASDLSSPMKG
jgi:hypothetical protein